MKIIYTLCIFLMLGGFLSACGQKGALYLPKQPSDQSKQTKPLPVKRTTS